MNTKSLMNCVATAAIAPAFCAMALNTDSRQTEGGGGKKVAITEIKIDWPGKHSERVETPQGQDKQGNELPPEVWYTEPFDNTFLNIGEDWEIEFEVLPEGADTTSLIWNTSNPHVADVSKGVVTGLEHGETEITVTTPDGKVSAKVTVIVTSPIVE
ncbi:MAG: Ig-like domain-containing protein [Holophagales bacterium]|nr:Ig-like domain-containing protein [Holophagales bacterium]